MIEVIFEAFNAIPYSYRVVRIDGKLTVQRKDSDDWVEEGSVEVITDLLFQAMKRFQDLSNAVSLHCGSVDGDSVGDNVDDDCQHWLDIVAWAGKDHKNASRVYMEIQGLLFHSNGRREFNWKELHKAMWPNYSSDELAQVYEKLTKADVG